MPPTGRLFGPDREEIVDLDPWFAHAPPEKGAAQWKDGYSAKEQAKAWLRSGTPIVPEELWSAISKLAGDVDEVYGRPEHTTTLDSYPRARHHDLFACPRHNGATTVVLGVEAKACESFDGTVADRATAAAPSNKRTRCNLLSRALFGRDVLNEDTGDLLDSSLANHGYQLWTAAVGTLIEAQQRNVSYAVVVVQQFAPADVLAAQQAGDDRDWSSALTANADAFHAFAAEVQTTGSQSHATDFVAPGTKLHVIEVESRIEI